MTKFINFLVMFINLFTNSAGIAFVIRELIHDSEANIPLSGLIVSLVVLNIGVFKKEYEANLFNCFNNFKDGNNN